MTNSETSDYLIDPGKETGKDQAHLLEAQRNFRVTTTIYKAVNTTTAIPNASTYHNCHKIVYSYLIIRRPRGLPRAHYRWGFLRGVVFLGFLTRC